MKLIAELDGNDPVDNRSYVTSTGNGTNDVTCRLDVPYSYELLRDQHSSAVILITVLWACVLLILANFIEEIIFIIRNFQTVFRKQRTIYILGLMPVFSICALIGVMVPRAGILVDLVSNSYFGFAMYSWMSLIGHYLGSEKMARARDVTVIRLSTLPCCCFCLCLPKPKFNRKTYLKLLIMVYQVTVMRPILSFIAAVLWADGQYIPGELGNNPFTYISVLNSVSTLFAIWGLIIVQTAFRDTLSQYRIVLKFLILQLTLIGTVVANTVIAALVLQNVIQCTEFIPTGARAARIDNSFLVVWMLFLSVLGRIAFRRKQDGIFGRSTGLKEKVLNVEECTETPEPTDLVNENIQGTGLNILV